MPGGVFYGFPELEAGEIKIAEHSGGEPVDDPLAVDRELHAERSGTIGIIHHACLPDVSLTTNRARRMHVYDERRRAFHRRPTSGR